MVAPTTDYYADLGVTKEATPAEITKAFRKLALTCHPDRGGDQDEFTKINKAYEVLSDAKARARYDGTGRTTPLSAEEEFRESFFNLNLSGAGGSKRAAGGGGGAKQASEAEKEEARKKEVERQEAQRRLDEADRRDAERRARLAGGPVPQAPPPAAVPPPAAASSGPVPALTPGLRVKLHSLSSRPELNGLTGVLVAQVQDKWQVRLDGDGGEKLMKAKNLMPERSTPAPPAATASAPPMQKAAPSVTPSPVQPKAGMGAPSAQPKAAASPQEKRCAHPKCNYLAHTNKSLTTTNCCRACAGTQAHMEPNHGPQCQRRTAPGRGADTPQQAKPQPPPVLPTEQPTHRYQVLTEFAFVRNEANHDAPVYGKKQRGEVVTAAEETFDGWVHLADQPGWMIRDMFGRQGVGQVLAPVGGEPPLAIPKPIGRPGAVEFQVVFKPHIALRAGPNKQAQIQGIRKFGEPVVAVMQTYGGWVQLKDVNNVWALTTDPTFGKLLECKEVQAQSKADQEALLTELRQAERARDPNALQQALLKARAGGLDKRLTAGAEVLLAEVKSDMVKQASKKQEFRLRVERAKDNERELRECVDDGAKDGFKEETVLAQRMLNEVLEAKNKTQAQHQGLLDRLAAAAASGDKQEMKLARDAAQKGGVDKKEIARIFSLNIINSGEKPTQVLSGAPPPPAPVSSSAPAPVEDAKMSSSLDFSLGARVTICELVNRKELNGVAGVLVAQRDGSWQVLLFNGAGMKLFKEKNLAPYDPNAPPPTLPPAAPREAEAVNAGVDINSADSQEKEDAEAPQVAGSSPLGFDGRWVSDDGEWMGTIENGTLQWAEGPLVDLRWLSERSFSCEMSAEGVTETFSAELDSEGRLLWCDGDLWSRE